MQTYSWPPSYTVKRHPQARRVNFRITSEGLLVTIPMRFSIKHIPKLMEMHRQWIQQKLSNSCIVNKAFLPEIISIALFKNSWKVSYCQADGRAKWFLKPNNELQYIGCLKKEDEIKKSLSQYLKYYIKEKILILFESVANEIQLTYNAVNLRSQKSLWGSCTSDKNISLNYKLMFLPYELVKYVMIHELCHTIHHNHSKLFWQLVEKYDPFYQQHRHLLRSGNFAIPAWFK